MTSTSWLFCFLPALMLSPTSVQQHLSSSRVSPPKMAVEHDDRKPQRLRLWRKRAKSAAATITAATALAIVPRGAARALLMPPSGEVSSVSISRDAPPSYMREQQQQQLAFTWYGREKTLKAPLPTRNRKADIDMDAVIAAKKARQYTERGFIFSEDLTKRPELVQELEEMKEREAELGWASKGMALATYGIAAGGVYLTVSGLSGFERFMKQQELEEIEEERERTGQYISVDATDTETAIDPKTGKNLTIVKRAAPNATATDGSTEKAPWILRVLGLDDAPASNDLDFFDAPAAGQGALRRVEDGSGGSSVSRQSSPEQEGGEDDDDASGGGGGDGVEDDTSDIDDISDLL